MTFGYRVLILALYLPVLPTWATNHFAGVVAANSIGGTSTYTCRTADQWNALATDAKNNGFESIHIEGFDCNALNLASAAAAAAGLQEGTIAASTTQIDNDVQTFRTAYATYGADRYLGLAVGNEVDDTVDNIMAKVYDVRGYLGSVGVTTPISTTHTWVMVRDNPALCGADFAGANAHAFYDGSVTSGQAGTWLSNTVIPALKAACPGKKLYITETGWPSEGDSYGAATASVADETNALSELNCASQSDTSVSVYAFEYDDQLWKATDNERSFGIGKINLQSDVFAAC